MKGGEDGTSRHSTADIEPLRPRRFPRYDRPEDAAEHRVSGSAAPGSLVPLGETGARLCSVESSDGVKRPSCSARISAIDFESYQHTLKCIDNPRL